MTDTRQLGPYSPHQKLRDISTLAMLATQTVLWLNYATLWSLILPVVLFGTLAAYFTAKDGPLFDLIWKNHAHGMIKGLVAVTVICIAASFYAYQSKYWLMLIIFADCLYVFWATMLGWVVRERFDH